MQYDTIRFEQADDIAVVTLNRPEVMNALNTQMRAEITHAVRDAAKSARVVVLTGEG
ncbi:MAG: enoyl-CoA hydratase/isomerase family protein, partial [Alphaproteobacteria bacterium]|nr:enoyl-CoA hydratase/isomerase family protein [Alphaproteobacteria bacterium]MBU1573197.1 enoyl-CoA hydratase/isomerase family protein [Alphaproteobacteria bacterium]